MSANKSYMKKTLKENHNGYQSELVARNIEDISIIANIVC